MRRFALAASLALAPGAASAHDAFGDLGPFYASLLHPLVDPAQGLLVAAAAVLLARQPLASVRPAFAALALCGALAVALHAVTAPPAAPGLRATGIAVAILGALALSGLRLGPAAAVLAAAAAVVAGLSVDLPPGFRAGALAALGGSAGIALLALFVWGGVDLAARRVHPAASAVAASWVAAIGIMVCALPN